MKASPAPVVSTALSHSRDFDLDHDHYRMNPYVVSVAYVAANQLNRARKDLLDVESIDLPNLAEHGVGRPLLASGHKHSLFKFRQIVLVVVG